MENYTINTVTGEVTNSNGQIVGFVAKDGNGNYHFYEFSSPHDPTTGQIDYNNPPEYTNSGLIQDSEGNNITDSSDLDGDIQYNSGNQIESISTDTPEYSHDNLGALDDNSTNYVITGTDDNGQLNGYVLDDNGNEIATIENGNIIDSNGVDTGIDMETKNGVDINDELTFEDVEFNHDSTLEATHTNSTNELSGADIDQEVNFEGSPEIEFDPELLAAIDPTYIAIGSIVAASLIFIAVGALLVSQNNKSKSSLENTPDDSHTDKINQEEKDSQTSPALIG